MKARVETSVTFSEYFVTERKESLQRLNEEGDSIE